MDPLQEIARHRLGYVGEPEIGDEKYQGCLVIPYLRWNPEDGWLVSSVRYRRLDNESPKYLTLPGDRPRIYNATILLDPTIENKIAITEGELDCITACMAGVPAVGIPGATSFKDHWYPLFEGFDEVLILADGDDPGRAMGKTLMKRMKNAHMIPMPPGEDVNSYYKKVGIDGFRAYVGRA